MVCFIHHLRFEFSTTQSDDDDNISVMLFYYYKDKQSQPETAVIDLDNIILSSSRNFDEAEEFSPEQKDIDQINADKQNHHGLCEEDEEEDGDGDVGTDEYPDEASKLSMDETDSDGSDDDDGFVSSSKFQRPGRPAHGRRKGGVELNSDGDSVKNHQMKRSDSSILGTVSYLIRSVGITEKISILFQSSHPVSVYELNDRFNDVF